MSRAVRKGGTYPHAASQILSHRERLLESSLNSTVQASVFFKGNAI